jgi:hypothetical protein
MNAQACATSLSILPGFEVVEADALQREIRESVPTAV